MIPRYTVHISLLYIATSFEGSYEAGADSRLMEELDRRTIVWHNNPIVRHDGGYLDSFSTHSAEARQFKCWLCLLTCGICGTGEPSKEVLRKTVEELSLDGIAAPDDDYYMALEDQRKKSTSLKNLKRRALSLGIFDSDEAMGDYFAQEGMNRDAQKWYLREQIKSQDWN